MTNTTSNAAAPMAFDPWLLWVAFRKHWGWAIPLGLLVGSLAAVGVWSTFEKEYEAMAMLEANKDFLVFPTNNGRFGRDLAKSEKQLILRGPVFDKVLVNPSLHSAPSLSNPQTRERELASRVGVSNGGTDNYLLLTYRDSNSKQAANVCNEIVKAYLEIRESTAQQRTSEILKLLRPEIERWKRDAESSREKFQDIYSKSLGRDPFKLETAEDNVGARESELHVALGRLKIEIAIVQATKKTLELEAIVPNPPDSLEIQQYIDESPEVVSLMSSMRDRQASIAKLERNEQHVGLMRDRYQRLLDEVSDYERRIAEAKLAIRPKAEQELAKRAEARAQDERARQLRDLDRRLASYESELQAVSAEYEKEMKRVKDLKGETFDVYLARQDYERKAEVLEQHESRMMVLQTEQQQSSSIRLIQAAKEPTAAIEEAPLKKMGMAGFAGFLLPFGIAVLLEFIVKRVVDSKRLEAAVKAPLLGEISRYTGGTLNDSNRRMFTESVDALRANLSFKLEGVRSIVITSAMPAEGKSSVASQLAISLAKAFEEPVLLVDADVRLPGLHSMFGLSFGPGLTNVLRGQVATVDAINTSPGDLVHVMTAGKLSGSPHTLLSKKNLKEFLASIPERYRYVVIDTAPVLPAAETLSLAAAADATIVCAMRDVSRTDHLERAQRQLKSAGANILGTVFSGIPSREYAYRYGDYRYAYGSKS